MEGQSILFLVMHTLTILYGESKPCSISSETINSSSRQARAGRPHRQSEQQGGPRPSALASSTQYSSTGVEGPYAIPLRVYLLSRIVSVLESYQ